MINGVDRGKIKIVCLMSTPILNLCRVIHVTLKFSWGSFPFQPAGRGKEDGRPCLESFDGPRLEEALLK